MKLRFKLIIALASLLTFISLINQSVALAVGVVQLTIKPNTPDGSNGYYKTQPRFSLTEESGATSMYKVDSGEWNIHTGVCDAGSINIARSGPSDGTPVGVGTHTIYYSQYTHHITYPGYPPCSGTVQPNSTIYTHVVKYDPNSPSITFTSPGENSTLNQNSVTVTGKVTDPTSPISVLTLNGQGVTIGSDGAFSTNISLTSGLNRVVAQAYDMAGNSSAKELFFTAILQQNNTTTNPNSPNTSSNQNQPSPSNQNGQSLGESADNQNSNASENLGLAETKKATKSATQSSAKENKDSKNLIKGSFSKPLLGLTLIGLLAVSGFLAFKFKLLSKLKK
mgnify:FL=1